MTPTPPSGERPLESWRDEFPILRHTTYLNSCSLGALSRRSLGYVGEFHALWNAMGAAAWYEEWWGRLDALRSGVATFWNAEPGEIALSSSVSAAIGSVASGIDYGRRNRVVVAEMDFPTLAYQWMGRSEVEVVRVPSDDGIGVTTERWLEAIDDRTAVVATSHVFFSTGFVQDLPPIAEAAHRAGALFIVDGYQAAGQLDVDARALGADVYASGPLKWMLGGPGLAYLWVRRERIEELAPAAPSWFGVEDQFGFDIEKLHLRDDARRFEPGTPALSTVHSALGGLEILLEAGMPRVAERIRTLTDDLLERLAGSGLEARYASDPARRSGIVTVEVPAGRDAKVLADRLRKRSVVVDARDRFIRISPHFYNTVEENEVLVDELGRVFESG